MTATALPDYVKERQTLSDVQETFVPIHEVAARLQVSESTVRSWFDQDIIVVTGFQRVLGASRAARSND